MAFTLNHAQITRKFTTPTKRTQAAARSRVNARFKEHKEQLLTDIGNDSITQELAGNGRQDGSQFLGGRSGNLRAFIGFYDEDNPADELLSLIRNGVKLLAAPPQVTMHGNVALYRFRAQTPTLKELYEETPYPDEWNGGSWLRGIEHGISGLRYYLFSTDPKKLKSFQNSRSGYAVQSKKVVKDQPSSFKGRRYISKYLEEFKRKVAY